MIPRAVALEILALATGTSKKVMGKERVTDKERLEAIRAIVRRHLSSARALAAGRAT